jgi:mannosyltransferase
MLFGLASGVLAWFFLYLLLVPLALCGLLLLSPRLASQHTRRTDATGLRRNMVFALGGALLGALPIITLAAFQRNQVSFLAHRGYLSPKGLLITPWFSSLPVAVVLWALIVMGAVVARRVAEQRATALLALTWLVAPALVLIAVDVLISPTYNPRYLAVSLGAVALLAARGFTGILDVVARRRRGLMPVAGLLLTAIVLGVTVPQYLHERTPYAKDGGADFRFAAEVIGQHAQVGDTVLFGEGPRPSRTARLTFRLYPQDFAGLQDPQLVTSYDQRAGLWDRLASVSAVAPELRENTVWLLESKGASTASEDLSALRRSGYALSSKQRVHRITVYEFTKGAHHE